MTATTEKGNVSNSRRSYLQTRLRLRIFLYLILLTGLIIVLLIPDQLLFGSDKSLCLHKAVTGIPCPLCGLTRASHELASLRLHSALTFNPLIISLLLLLGTDLLRIFLPGKNTEILFRLALWISLAGTIVLYTLRIITNI